MTNAPKNKFFNQKYLTLLSVILFTAIFFLWPSHSYAAMDPIWQILKNYQVADSLGSKVYGIWNIFIKLTNGFVVVVLIAVAFAQILRLNINTYGVKKILPTLVLAIIAANFSFLFCRLLIDFSSVLISLFLQGTDGTKTNASNVVGSLSNIAASIGTLSGTPCTGSTNNNVNCYNYGTLFWQGIGNLMILAGAILILILAFLFIIRNWLIYFLVALAPLAFMSLVLPQTKSLFNQWWSNFSKWVFMPVVSVFWIWVGSQWFSLNIGGQGTLMSFVFAGVCFYLAITTPFKMGGAIMSAWGNLGKKAWGRTGGAAWNATGGAGIKAGKDWVNWKYDTAKGRGKEWAKSNLPIIKQISARSDRATIQKDLDARGLKKLEQNRRETAIMQVLGSKSQAQWDQPKNKMAYSRMKSLLLEMTTDETGPQYQNEFKVKSLVDKMRYTDDGLGGQKKATAYDIASGKTLYKVNELGVVDTANPLTNYNKAEIWKEYSAAAKEMSRRKRVSSLNRADASVGGLTPEEVYNNLTMDDIGDYRYMAASAVGTPSGGSEINAQTMAAHVEQLDIIAGPDREKVVHAALSDLYFDPSTITSHVDPNNMKELQESFDSIKGRKTELISEISKSVEDYVEDVGVGLKRSRDYLKHTGRTTLPDLKLDEKLAALNSPDSGKQNEAIAFAKNFDPGAGLLGKDFSPEKAQEVLRQTQKAMTAANQHGVTISANLDIEKTKEQIGNALKADVGFHADTRVGTEIAAARMANHESLKNMPIAQAHSSDVAMSMVAEQMKSVLDAHHANTSGMSAAEFKTMAKQAFAGATINKGIPSGTTMGQLSTEPRYERYNIDYINKLSQNIGDQTAKAFKKHGMAPKIENTAHIAPPTTTTQPSTKVQPPTYVAPPPNLTAQPQSLRSTLPLNLTPPTLPPKQPLKMPPHDIDKQ